MRFFEYRMRPLGGSKVKKLGHSKRTQQTSPAVACSRLSDGRGADGGARTRDRKVTAEFRADSQAIVPSTPRKTGRRRNQRTRGRRRRKG
ncbi:hypothetical protein PoB_000131300 [Plakobranchus ocellatus]|uniref:Uncharacterized protein n=1 Tax=Plakobranchus ocellatus TaxID=259542 RepID=A0AAV3XWQ6_9GAST|nr:hypothetical protein PoB_000131300 [Plakobranchus ocellatus]